MNTALSHFLIGIIAIFYCCYYYITITFAVSVKGTKYALTLPTVVIINILLILSAILILR
jgi:hypothetical protein